MTRFQRGAVSCLSLLSVGVAMAACTNDPPTSPPQELSAAKGGPTSGPTIRSVNPDSGFRSTTLDVRVLGSGFDRGSRATWALDGDTAFATTRIRTNSTRHIKSGELIANITIEGDAPLSLYDIIVITLAGKKGIGTELFAVTLQLIDLGTLGGVHSWANAINSLGQVVGTSYTASGERHAFLWSEATGMQDLGTLSGTVSEAYGINDDGVVVGVNTDTADPAIWRAFRWTAATGMQALEPALAVRNEARAINALGEIGGFAHVPELESPTVWAAGGREALDTAWAEVWALNTRGQAVGGSQVFDQFDRATLWERGASGWTRQVLFPTTASTGRSINDAGQIVGYRWRADGGYSGFVREPSGTTTALPGLTTAALSDAFGINPAGVVVGFSGDNSEFRFPVVWIRDDTDVWRVARLPVLSHGDAEARAINARGDIAGYTAGGGSAGRRAVLWKMP